MLGVKTRIIKGLRKTAWVITKGNLTSKSNIKILMETFRADTWGHVGNLPAADLGYAWTHYALIRLTKPDNVLCIGSRHGFIPAVCAQACKDNQKGHVDFVDAGYGESSAHAWTGVGYWKKEQGLQIFKKFRLSKYIKLHVETTSNFSDKHKNKSFGYIYIDGDHSFKGVLTDYKLFWPKLIKNGFMTFHDISVTKKMPEGEYGVWKLWKKIARKNSIIFPNDKSGLGIIQKT